MTQYNVSQVVGGSGVELSGTMLVTRWAAPARLCPGRFHKVAAGSASLRLHATRAANPLTVLGLSHGATRVDIKKNFYALAKQVHPDVSDGSGDDASTSFTFVEVLAAYEALITEHDAAASSGARPSSSTTAPRTAARGGSASTQRTQHAARPSQSRREWTVGEILCEQLLEKDCSAATLEAVWNDLKALHVSEAHPTSEFMVDSLIGACVRTGGGLDGALELFHDGKRTGPLAGATAQVAAVCAIMKWAGEDSRVTFEFAVGLVDVSAQTPEALERMHSAYYLYFGVDPLTAWR